MGKRYGQRPSSLLPSQTFETEYETLYFDMNVMLIGMAAEIRAQREAQSRSGRLTSSRQDAIALAMRARMVAGDN